MAVKLVVKGVIKDKKVHLAVLETVTTFMLEAGFSVKGDFSDSKADMAMLGSYAFLEKSEQPKNELEQDLVTVVEAATRI